jgi:hypothetical protein
LVYPFVIPGSFIEFFIANFIESQNFKIINSNLGDKIILQFFLENFIAKVWMKKSHMKESSSIHNPGCLYNSSESKRCISLANKYSIKTNHSTQNLLLQLNPDLINVD